MVYSHTFDIKCTDGLRTLSLGRVDSPAIMRCEELLARRWSGQINGKQHAVNHRSGYVLWTLKHSLWTHLLSHTTKKLVISPFTLRTVWVMWLIIHKGETICETLPNAQDLPSSSRLLEELALQQSTETTALAELSAKERYFYLHGSAFMTLVTEM